MLGILRGILVRAAQSITFGGLRQAFRIAFKNPAFQRSFTQWLNRALNTLGPKIRDSIARAMSANFKQSVGASTREISTTVLRMRAPDRFSSTMSIMQALMLAGELSLAYQLIVWLLPDTHDANKDESQIMDSLLEWFSSDSDDVREMVNFVSLSSPIDEDGDLSLNTDDLISLRQHYFTLRRVCGSHSSVEDVLRSIELFKARPELLEIARLSA